MDNFIEQIAEDRYNENCCYFCREKNNGFSKKSAGLVCNDYFCPHCGHYQITREAIYNLHLGANFRLLAASIAQEKTLSGQDGYLLQWYNIPDNDDDHKICIGNVPFLNDYPKDYLEKLDRILINIGRKTNNSPLNDYQPDFHDFGLFFVEPSEVYYRCNLDDLVEGNTPVDFVTNQICDTINILQQTGWINIPMQCIGEIPHIFLSVDGLKHLQELYNTIEDKSQPFVAMWFPSEGEYVGILNNYVNSITKSIQIAGYSNPYIANRDKYNGAIMNKVINQIKESRFLIADLTCDEKSGMRGGVYYEAGLANGLGMPVILTCHKKAQNFVHFDLKQFNTIFWDFDEKGIIRADGHPDEDFSDYLAEWIIATVGKKK